jgi:hypothetical protein
MSLPDSPLGGRASPPAHADASGVQRENQKSFLTIYIPDPQ